jgi:hypothetical protein
VSQLFRSALSGWPDLLCLFIKFSRACLDAAVAVAEMVGYFVSP